MVRQRTRICFGKQGDLRFIGHRDLVRLMERLFRRAGLRLAMSQGFHPKPRMNFPSALAVGIEGRNELMELELAETCTAEGLLCRLAPHTVPGLSFHSAEILPPGTRKARLRSATYRVTIPSQLCAEVSDRAARLMAGSLCPIERPDGRARVDVRGLIEELTLSGGVLRIRLHVSPQGGVRLQDVLLALELADLQQEGNHLERTTVELQS